jgi:hypothetical protein
MEFDALIRYEEIIRRVSVDGGERAALRKIDSR